MLRIPINEQGWGLFLRLLQAFRQSEFGARALTLTGALIVFLLAINGLNIANSYVGRDFMSAIAERNTPGFFRLAVLYLGVFATITVVLSSIGSARKASASFGGNS